MDQGLSTMKIVWTLFIVSAFLGFQGNAFDSHGYGGYGGGYDGYAGYRGVYGGYDHGSHGSGMYGGYGDYGHGGGYGDYGHGGIEYQKLYGSSVKSPFGSGGQGQGLNLNPYYAYSKSAYENYKYQTVKYTPYRAPPSFHYGHGEAIESNYCPNPTFSDYIRSMRSCWSCQMPLEDYSGNIKTVSVPANVNDEMGVPTSMPNLYPNGNYRPAGYNPKTEACCPNTDTFAGTPVVATQVSMPFFDPRTYMCYAVCPASLPNPVTYECCPTSMVFDATTMACAPCPPPMVYMQDDPLVEGMCVAP